MFQSLVHLQYRTHIATHTDFGPEFLADSKCNSQSQNQSLRAPTHWEESIISDKCTSVQFQHGTLLTTLPQVAEFAVEICWQYVHSYPARLNAFDRPVPRICKQGQGCPDLCDSRYPHCTKLSVNLLTGHCVMPPSASDSSVVGVDVVTAEHRKDSRSRK